VPYFASLWWNTRLFANGSAGRAVALQLARVAAAVVVLILLVRLGPFALLSGAIGFVAARALLLSRFGGL
jgi:F1F0 ATPase subunit 2